MRLFTYELTARGAIRGRLAYGIAASALPPMNYVHCGHKRQPQRAIDSIYKLFKAPIRHGAAALRVVGQIVIVRLWIALRPADTHFTVNKRLQSREG